MSYAKLHNVYSITSGSTVVSGSSTKGLMYWLPSGQPPATPPGECHIRLIDVSFGGNEASLSPVKVSMATTSASGSYPTGASVFAHWLGTSQSQPSPVEIYVDGTTAATQSQDFKVWYVTPYMSRLYFEFPENSLASVYGSSQPITINVENPNVDDIPVVINCIMTGGDG